MLPSKRLLMGVTVAAALAPASALATTPSSTAPAKAHKTGALERQLLHSHDTMYMSFRLQYLDSATKSWINLSSGASSGFVAVGSGASARQGGTSFVLKPVAGKPAVTLRGVVDFQWRHGKTIVVSGATPSTAAHLSLAGADPANYSAATCVIG
jgi:hypothetical protein